MRISFFKLFIVIVLPVLGIFSCKTPSGQAARDLEKEYLTKYIAKYHPTVSPTSTGLYFVDVKPGTETALIKAGGGKWLNNSTASTVADTVSIKAGDLVEVYYSGNLIEDDPTEGIRDGYEFDASGQFEPFSFTVGAGAVVAGWDEAIRLMKKGSKAILIIPSKLAYSSQSQSSIPAYSPLVFYIHVYKVYRSTDVWQPIQILPKGSN